MLPEWEQAVAEELLTEHGDVHTVDSVALTCYLGVERREPDNATGLYRQVRVLIAPTADLVPPAPHGRTVIDGTAYYVEAVATVGTVFRAELARLQ